MKPLAALGLSAISASRPSCRRRELSPFCTLGRGTPTSEVSAALQITPCTSVRNTWSESPSVRRECCSSVCSFSSFTADTIIGVFPSGKTPGMGPAYII